MLDSQRQLDLFESRESRPTSFVGVVKRVNPYVSPASGRYVLVNPVFVGGMETENGNVSFSPDTSITIPVAVLIGIPIVGDRLIVRSEPGSGRWVSEKSGSMNPYYPQPVVTLPGCNCPLPLNLYLTFSAGSGCFPSATITYGPIPSDLAAYDFPPGSMKYFSTTKQNDGPGDFYWFIECIGGGLRLRKSYVTYFNQPVTQVGEVVVLFIISQCDPFAIDQYYTNQSECTPHLTG